MMLPLLALAWLAAAPQADVPTFRTGVSLVRVDVEVTDGSGRDVSGLTQRDFVVYDEGERREISNFSRDTDPLDVALVVDVSGSMWQHLRTLTSTAATALRQLRPGDRAALVLFASRAEVVQPLTSDFRSIEQRLLENMYKQTLGRGTLLNEAIVEAASYLARSSPKGTRRAILVITDNEAAPGHLSNEDAAKAVSGIDAVVSAILVGASDEPGNSRYGNPAASGPDVTRIAKQAGGRSVTSSDVPEALASALAQLRTRYSLQYVAPDASGNAYRHIRVELTPAARGRFPRAELHAREGYFAGEAAGETKP